MEHLDEGTIHAWIDGAVDATRSREIEAHVAQCPACSAAVAEARGLIAASSRILNALDDVPGGVVPKRAPGVLPVAARSQPRRRISAWIPAAAAAGLILAVGLVQVNREKGVVAEMSNVALDTIATLRPQVANLTADSAAPQQPPSAAQSRMLVGGTSAAARGPAGALSRPRDMSLADARTREEGRSVAAVGGGAANQVAAAPAPPPPTAPAAKKENVAADSRGERQALKSAPEPTVVTAAPEAAAARRLDRASITDVPALPQTLAGCYRTDGETRESFLAKAANVAGTVAGAAAGATDTKRSRAPAAAPAPAAQARASAADFAAAVVPNVVRLDTTARPLGLPVLGERSDSLIGWWTRSGRDSAQVRFLSGIVVTVTAKNRVTCPER